ncbi:MAG: S41 family peptidase [Oscillospiraceae bacterium]|nr:S41 family peptidase [Oscillospiraceae bacterium]
MNRKFSLGVCVSLIAIACAVTFVLTMSLSLNLYNEKIAGVGQREAIYTKMQDVDTVVRNNFIGTIDEDALANGIMNGYMAGLGDGKSTYITATGFITFQQRMNGKIVTVGLEAVRHESGYITITEVYEGSSAELQGIEAGDLITEINNAGVLEIGADAAIRLLSGDEGTRVELMTTRDGETRRHILTRQEIELRTARGVNFEDIGFIRISGLADNTGSQFENVLDELLENGARALVLDIRGTDGCLRAPLRQILNRLIPRSTAAIAEYRNGNLSNFIEIVNDSHIGLPITVITDANTAEGGELLAAVLKDFAGAQIVGVTTKGDAVFTQVQTLGDGSALLLSVMKVRSGGGTTFDGEGIRPDFFIELTTAAETDLYNLENTYDVQIRKALEVTSVNEQ